METERQTAKAWITDGIIIAGLTATAYFWTLYYEIAFSYYFSIPYYFISLSPVNVLITAGPFLFMPTIVCIFVIFLDALQPFTAYISAFASRFGRRSLRNRAIIFISTDVIFSSVIILFSFLVEEVYLKVVYIIIGVSAIVIAFVRPLYRQRGEKCSYWRKMILDQVPSKRATRSRQLLIRTPSFREIIDLMLIAVFLILIIIGNNIFRKIGKENAEKQEEFQVIAQSPDMPEVVVLRVYGDYLFAAPFNRSTREVEKKFFILKTSEIKTPLTTEKVGPLVPLQVKP